MKRFYKAVAVVADSEGHRVALDGRTLRSPAKASLAFPRMTLAEAVAAEWDSQTETIEPRRMPLMSIASTAVDRIAPRRAAVVDEIVRYAETELLCYRAEAPQELVERQEQVWQPLLDWAAMRYDARLEVTESILPQQQSEHSLRALRRAVEAFDDFELACLHGATTAGGSLITALALFEHRLEPETAAETVQLDERYQAGIWGEDPEVTRRWAFQAAEMAAARRFFDLLRG